MTKSTEEIVAEWRRGQRIGGSPVIIQGIDIPIGELVVMAFKWLLALTIAGIPFAVVALIVIALTS